MARVEIPYVVEKIVGGNAQPVNGASVQVNVRGSSAALIYNVETGGAPIANPTTTDANGEINVWVDEGSYDLVISGSGITTRTVPIELSRGDALVSIATTRLADGAVSTAKLQDSAVTTAKIVDGSITQAKITSGLSLLPTGVILPFGGATAPSGFVMCDGASYTTASKTALFNVIGYAYGGSGANFNVPDLRGRVSVGADNAGTGAANRLPNSARALGQNGGEERHTLTTAELAAHSHATNQRITDPSSQPTPWDNGNFVPYAGRNSNFDSTTNSGPINAAGSNTPHNNMQPYAIVNHVIKT